jgi:hypothetical protein
MNFIQLAALYKKLDQDTISLLTRFIGKGVSEGNVNKYIKKVLRRELGEREEVVTTGEMDNG